MASDAFLYGVRAFILEQGLGRCRAGILRKQLSRMGGRVEEKMSPDTTHLLVGNSVRRVRLPALLGGRQVPPSVVVVRADWLSSSLQQGKLVPEEEYVVSLESTLQPDKEGGGGKEGGKEGRGGGEGKEGRREGGGVGEAGDVVKVKELKSPIVDEVEKKGIVSNAEGQTPVQKFPTFSRRWKTSPHQLRKDRDSDSDYVDSGGEEEGEGEREEEGETEEEGEEEGEAKGRGAGADTSTVPLLAKRKRRWVCEIPASEAQSWANHNAHITDKLQELVGVYQNSGEKWRAMSTIKVIQAIKKYPKKITTYEEAQALPFVGKRLADKIMEIVSSGQLRRLEYVDKEKERVISLFLNIHGVGQTTAHQFYAQGYRSIDELESSVVLNRVQRVGVKHYHEFLERMVREEVAEIEQKVKEICAAIKPGLEVITCGSYRRGKATCGDVDILVTHPDGRSHHNLLPSYCNREEMQGS